MRPPSFIKSASRVRVIAERCSRRAHDRLSLRRAVRQQAPSVWRLIEVELIGAILPLPAAPRPTMRGPTARWLLHPRGAWTRLRPQRRQAASPLPATLWAMLLARIYVKARPRDWPSLPRRACNARRSPASPGMDASTFSVKPSNPRRLPLPEVHPLEGGCRSVRSC